MTLLRGPEIAEIFLFLSMKLLVIKLSCISTAQEVVFSYFGKREDWRIAKTCVSSFNRSRRAATHLNVNIWFVSGPYFARSYFRNNNKSPVTVFAWIHS